jgi:hypothetical protein
MTTRRLAAILAADVVGFSKLVGEDEAVGLEPPAASFDHLVGPEEQRLWDG